MKKIVTVMMAVAVALAVVVRGETLCFCDDDPDDCGHACHECGGTMPDGLSDGEFCLHLELGTLDLVPAVDDVRLPSTPGPTAVFPPLAVRFVSETDIVPRATSPPPLRAAFCSYSTRLFPRS